MNQKLWILPLAAIMLLLTVSSALASTNITDCMVINQSGEYILTTDLVQNETFPDDACIFVDDVDNVEIDGQGHSITFTNTSTNNQMIFLVAPAFKSNITVKNLQLIVEDTTDWLDVISIYRYSDILIKNVNLSFDNPKGNYIGYYWDAGSGGDNLIFEDSTVQGHEYALIDGYSNLTIRNTRWIADTSVSADFGLLLDTVQTASIYNNYFSDNDGSSFIAYDSSTNVQTYNNTFNATTLTFDFTGSTGVTFNNSEIGNAYINPAGTGFSQTCTNDGSGICDATYNVSGVIDYLPIALSPPTIPPIAGQNITDCGGVANVSQTYYVQNNLTLSSGACIEISANNVTIDCQGYTIDGDGVSSGRGIDDVSNSYYAEIKNCIFKDFTHPDYGAVNIDFAKDWRVHNNTFESSNARSINVISGNNFFDGHMVYDNYIAATLQFQNFESSNQMYFYNNIFNETDYVIRAFSTLTGVTWNTTESVGTNIIGGPNTGGNYWTNSAGTGYSDTCNDVDSDGFCDDSYYVANEIMNDYLPLTTPGQCLIPTYNCTAYTNCTTADVLPCTTVVDSVCGINFTGTISDYDGVCDYCTPSWVCNGYGTCQVSTQSQACNSAADTNLCYGLTGLPSDQYGGNYSEFPSQACYTPGGYTAPDLSAIIIDGLGALGVFFIGFVALIAIIWLLGWLLVGLDAAWLYNYARGLFK